MRLLRLESDDTLSLIEFVGDNIPRYAIFSHTWGVDCDEVTFRDLLEDKWKSKAGCDKIRFCGDQATKDALQYFWIDTCCIDKSSSAELAEAINSMFRWYRNASKCYVYLSDVSAGDGEQITWESTFRDSRWFTRGWTLQELIAPPSVEFFSKEGKRLGDKRSLERQIHEITGIAIPALRGSALSGFSIADRISWAIKRETKREEDKAYSLLGIFDVYMPLIYGEGWENAFRRLRGEINKQPSISQLDGMAIQEFKELSGISLLGPQVATDAFSESLSTWLQPASVGENLQELLDQRHAGTCRWIFDTSEFKDWQASICPNMWLYGKPGSGKSVIMATLIRHLQTKGAIVAYFFCKLGNDNQRTLESIMRTWLWQILEQMPEYTELALQHRKKSLGVHTPLNPIKDAMGEIISKCNKSIYLVVDGFDECESGPASMDNLMAFLPTLGQKTLFAIASRPENWIRKAVNTRMYYKCSAIQVTNMRTEEDLGRWIQARILHMELADSNLEQLAITKLKDGADGMFLWAGLQLEAFEAQFAVEDAKAVLQNELPKDLESTYERLLANIQESPNPLRRARASQILQWITAANRPLTLRELDFALGIQIDSNLPPQQRSLMRGESDVLEARGSFVEITKTGHIRFVHASAKEFLSSKRVQFGLGLSQSHSKDPLQKALDAMRIARACVACLSLSGVGLDCTRPSKSSSIRSIKNFLAEYPFFEYAALNWWKHLNFLPYADEGLLKMTVSRFLGSSENTVRWLQLYQYLYQFHAAGNLFSSSDDPSCWVYVKDFWNAHLGPNSTNLFNRFHRWHTEMWFDGGILWPPIHIAAFFNFEDIIIRQLQHGFSVDHRNAVEFTPLMQAAHGDSPDAARVLIDHGADICAQTRYGYGAIRYACRNSLNTFLLLLQAGARADIVDRPHGFTPLHEIASSVLWHPQILHTLLSFADISDIINREDFQGNSPLDYASAIDVHLSASSLYQESFLDSEDPGAQFSRDKFLPSISRMFSAKGPQAFRMLHKGWLDLGVYTTIDSTFESVLGAVTVWKAQMIRKLVQKGAISALYTQQSKYR